MALVALNMDFVRPEIVSEGRAIIIKGGRHPLLEMYTENYVRNDFSSTDESGIVKIITGPNASGKSVYMKQVCEQSVCCEQTVESRKFTDLVILGSYNNIYGAYREFCSSGIG